MSRVPPPPCPCRCCKRDHLPRPPTVATGGGPRVCGRPPLIHRALPPLAAAPDRRRVRGGRGGREIGSVTGVRAPFPPRVLPVASVPSAPSPPMRTATALLPAQAMEPPSQSALPPTRPGWLVTRLSPRPLRGTRAARRGATGRGPRRSPVPAVVTPCRTCGGLARRQRRRFCPQNTRNRRHGRLQHNRPLSDTRNIKRRETQAAVQHANRATKTPCRAGREKKDIEEENTCTH